MGFTRISNAEINSRGATRLPNQPQISAAALKEEFDAPAKQVVAPKVNNLMDELESSTSAGNLGAVAPAGRTGTTVQGVINSVSADLATLEANAGTAIADAHTHSNKALLDTYTQSETDLASAVADDHTHSNKSLLDTYTQTEANISDAVSKKHEHSNKALLDTYSQSESDLADAVSKKHSHTNKALLDTYTQTNTDIADAVSSKHTHSNKTVLDKFGESGGNPTYDGNPIGGGGSGDAYKTIEAAGTSFVASGADTFKINAGSNVTIEALSGDKGIKINASGGGTSTGDMLMAQYDNSGDVKNASSTGNGIKDYVASAISGKADTSSLKDLAYIDKDGVSSTKYLRGDGTWQNMPTIPTKVSDLTNDSGYQTASDVSTAISGKADTSSLGDLAYIDIDGASSTKVLQGDGTWVVPSTGGHTMIPTTNDIATITGLQNGNDNYVINAYSAKRWSNAEVMTLFTTVPQGRDTIGQWDDNWTGSGASRVGWLWHSALHGILADDEVEITFVFDVNNNGADSETVSVYAYRVDDDVQNGGVDGGAIAIKLNGAIQNASGVKIGVNLKRQRTEVGNLTVLT